MPPQQFQRLLEVLSNGFDLGAHVRRSFSVKIEWGICTRNTPAAQEPLWGTFG